MAGALDGIKVIDLTTVVMALGQHKCSAIWAPML